MSLTKTYNSQTNSSAPAILELISELEKRDKETKGAVQAGSEAGAGFGDPRGYAVINTTGHSVGKVSDLYVDPNTRRPHFALLALGGHTLGIGDRHVLVGYEDIEVTADKQVHVRTVIS